jgi:hypothetical protein
MIILILRDRLIPPSLLCGYIINYNKGANGTATDETIISIPMVALIIA